MKTIDEMLDDILRQEGGYVNDPADRGGATNYGISLMYAQGKPQLDLDRDGDIDARDIQMVTPAIARQLYREDFFLRPRLHTLPEPLHPQLFDISVNSGPPRAIILLQRALRSLGYKIETDGRLGPQTRGAAEDAVEKFGWKKVNNIMVDARIAFYNAIIKSRPKNQKFRRGWHRRAKDFLA